MNTARKINPESRPIVTELEIRDENDEPWFRNFLHDLLTAPDLDLSQFEELERKKTSQELRKKGLY